MRAFQYLEAPLSDFFDYLVSKLFKYTDTYNKVNTPLRKDIKAMVEEDNTNAKAIRLIMLSTITSSLHTLSQAHLDRQVQLATAYLKIDSFTGILPLALTFPIQKRRLTVWPLPYLLLVPSSRELLY